MMRAPMKRYVVVAFVGIMAALTVALPVAALAERPATPGETAAIDRLLGASERTLHTARVGAHQYRRPVRARLPAWSQAGERDPPTWLWRALAEPCGDSR